MRSDEARTRSDETSTAESANEQRNEHNDAKR
jgi:hypothetical protein